MRLDQLLVERGLFPSREQARRSVMAGEVWVAGQRVDKPGTAIDPDRKIEVKRRQPLFVSRGGQKLDEALSHFRLEVAGKVCLDVGASTGGFTDCLLKAGARRVYAVDVGYGQLDAGLRADPRVVVLDRVNARYLVPELIGEVCDLITVDVSFISLVKVLPALLPVLSREGLLLPMIKPQFEVGRGRVGKGGIVRDEALRRAVIEERIEDFARIGLEARGVLDLDTTGAGGNREAFVLLRRASSPPSSK